MSIIMRNLNCCVFLNILIGIKGRVLNAVARKGRVDFPLSKSKQGAAPFDALLASTHYVPQLL